MFKTQLKKLLKHRLTQGASQALDGTPCGDRLTARLMAVIKAHGQMRSTLAEDKAFARALSVLQDWQSNRIKQTYAQLMENQSLGDATAFLLEEAYAGPNHEQLIADIERTTRSAAKLFPQPLLETACDILELSALTLELDCHFVNQLIDYYGTDQFALELHGYQSLFQNKTLVEQRRQQLSMIEQLSTRIEKYLGSQWLYATFKLVKLPAKGIGLASLVDFMDQGFRVFHAVPIPVPVLIQAIVDTELMVLERLQARHQNPFLVPWDRTMRGCVLQEAFSDEVSRAFP